jgi:methyltransferase (TIGR00027 family)
MCRPPAGTGGSVTAEPDSSAVRTALWRALHVEVDAEPHLIEDVIGLALADPADGWRDRGDMHPFGTMPYRAAIVARTRFVEDLLVDEGIGQYVLLGAGLDTFAQRHAELAGRVRVFEIDQPGPQAWKRRRLEELGYGVPDHLRLIPVDFDVDDDWWPSLVDAGFDPGERALVSSSGVSMYITEEATGATLRQLATMAPGSLVAMTFMVPFELADEADRAGLEVAARGATESGTPWISFYLPDEIVSLARDAGFADVRHVPTAELADRYLAGRADGLRAASGEGVLLART